MYTVALTDKALLRGKHLLPFGFTFTHDMQVVHASVYLAVLSLEASPELHCYVT